MALYDSADLLDRCKKLARRPATDAATSDADWYRYLTDAQLYWIGQFANHFPRLNWDTWEKLSTADNKLFTFSGVPLGRVEIHPTKRASYEMIAGTPDDGNADFFWEGEDSIRIPQDATRAFSDGPWARYIPRPDDIDANTEPVILPMEARKLLVYSAVEEWAHEGGLRDPKVFKDMIDALWMGQRPGDHGLLGQLKMRFGHNPSQTPGPWYKSPDLSGVPVATA